jgi:hypothetical protein
MALINLLDIFKKKTNSDLQKSAIQSVEWMKKKVSSFNRQPAGKFKIGGLFFFYYNPKGKATLPYYDQFPLVIPLERYPDGFLGLNLHYLPLPMRLAFLDKLMKYAIQGDAGEVMTVRISYDILKTSRGLKEFKPCLKRYLTSQVQSKLLAVEPNEWEAAISLPVQKFTGASSTEVWQESMKQIKG